MNPWIGRLIVLAGSIAMVLIPHRLHPSASRRARVVTSRKGPMERLLLTLVSIGFILAIIWVATPVLAFADYPLRPVPLTIGIVFLGAGLWLLYRSHSDLGTNWSITLEIKERHRLVAQGVYRRIRHPMYLALLLYSMGQALVLSNWLAGPSYGVALVILFAFRVRAEERMMVEHFGKDYESYMARTWRLVPGIW